MAWQEETMYEGEDGNAGHAAGMLPSPERAKREMEKLVAERLRKGYVDDVSG